MQRVRKEIGAQHIDLKSWQRHGITVAVLDTGMAVHPDLEGRQVAFYDRRRYVMMTMATGPMCAAFYVAAAECLTAGTGGLRRTAA